MQKTILCYGDSNTWGFIPQDLAGMQTIISRYPRTVRWPGVLQKILGDDYYVVEEGLNGRTTNLDYHIPPDRNGKKYLPSCLYSHAPIDIVVLALGGNDFKIYFSRQAEEIKNGLEELIEIIQASPFAPHMCNAPKIIVIPPPIPLPLGEEFKDENGVAIFKDAANKANELFYLCSKLSKEKGCYFLDASAHISPSQVDGLHLDDRGHQLMAESIANKIRDIFT